MKNLLISLTVLLSLAGSATAQVPNGGSPMVPNGGSGGGGGTPSAPVVINVAQFGATCDGVTNDDTAINNAISALRTLTQGANNNVNGVLTFNNGLRCLVNSLNFTGFTKGQIVIEGNGKAVYGRTAGVPVVDALGSTGITWRDFTILCSADAACTYGIQFGRVNTTALDGGGAGMIFDNMQVSVTATKAACYNFSGEGVYYAGLQCKNLDTTAASYGLALDGCNHFNITSAFVTELAPTDTCQSFEQNTVINGHIYGGNANGGGALFISGVADMVLENTYLLAGGTSCITMFGQSSSSSSNGTINNGRLGIHCEGTASPTDLMVVAGSLAAPVINGLYLSDPGPQPSNSIFKLGGSATTATIQNLDLNIPSSFTANAGTLRTFDAPQLWTVTGNAYFTTASFWNEPASWQGCVTLGTGKWCYPDRPGPLDFKSGATIAYSTSRKLGRSYTGPVVNAENQTNSNTIDLYADAADNTDQATASLLQLTNVVNFVTVYDQSGNANNLTTATAANQGIMTLSQSALGKRIVATYTKEGARSMPSASSVTYPFTTGGYMSFVVNQTGTPAANDRALSFSVGQLIINTSRQYTWQQSATGNGTWLTAAVSSAAHQMDIQYSAAALANVPTFNIDGLAQSLTATQPTGTVATTANPFVMGGLTSGGANGFPGDFPEIVAWASTPNANTLDAIRRNQAAYYGLSSVP